jgi:hypothetical protein
VYPSIGAKHQGYTGRLDSHNLRPDQRRNGPHILVLDGHLGSDRQIHPVAGAKKDSAVGQIARLDDQFTGYGMHEFHARTENNAFVSPFLNHQVSPSPNKKRLCKRNNRHIGTGPVICTGADLQNLVAGRCYSGRLIVK